MSATPIRRAVLFAGLGLFPAASLRAQLPDGWSATFTQGGRAVTTHVPSADLALAAGETPHPELGAQDLGAFYGARLRVPAAGRYRFGVNVEGGAAQLSVTTELRDPLGSVAAKAGQRAFTPWIELRQGEVELVLSFQRGEAQPARLRALWEMQPKRNAGFPVEPISSRAVRPWGGTEERVAEGLAALRGRALLEQKGCTSCHAPDEAQRESVGVRAAPLLARAGEHATAEWLERWIFSPNALRPGSDMPTLFDASPDERRAAGELARWLATATPREATAPEPAAVEAGRALYHSVGCVACHGALATPAELHGDPFLPDALPLTPPRSAFGDLAGKWTLDSLSAMLREPEVVYPDGRMPSLALSAAEASAIASYLVERWGVTDAPPIEVTAEALQRGRAAFAERGCAACHELDGAPAFSVAAPALAHLDEARGCLDPNDARTPRYDLSDDERAALALGLRSARAATGSPSPTDRARRAMLVADCAACHARDGQGGPAEDLRPYFVTLEDVDLGDEGRIPPDLTGVGFKLTTTWLDDVLHGAEPARPYMAARMPRFGDAHVEGLADALAALDGVPPHTDAQMPRSTDDLVLTGRALMGRDAMACVACHVFADHAPAGSPGTDLTRFAGRLRYEWFRAFLMDPVRYKPGTRMPAFGTGGQSTIRSIYGGDMHRQVDAMWAYFSLGEFMPAPPGLEPTSEMLLAVGERPRVFRGFLRSAGSRGIAVGFPIGVHYAFDAREVRVIDAWRGSFLDASGAWASRGGNVSGGRGPVAWTALDGPPLVLGPRPSVWPEDTGTDAGYRFRGYRLDAEGVPTLRYSIGDADVRERVEPRLDALVRRFELRGLPRTARLWLRVGESDHVVEEFRGGTSRESAGDPREDGSRVIELANVRGEATFVWTVPL